SLPRARRRRCDARCRRSRSAGQLTGPVYATEPQQAGVPIGADDGIRTRDPHLGKVMLYQLSHVRVGSSDYQRRRATGQPLAGGWAQVDGEREDAVFDARLRVADDGEVLVV